MRSWIGIMTIAIASLCSNTCCAENDAQASEAALVGRWQENLVAEAYQFPQAKMSNLPKGDILDFNSDHTLRAYMQCGQARSDWEKQGYSYLSGKWEIVGNGKIRIFLGTPDFSTDRVVWFKIEGDKLDFVSPATSFHELYVRLDGDMPPKQCPKADRTPKSK